MANGRISKDVQYGEMSLVLAPLADHISSTKETVASDRRKWRSIAKKNGMKGEKIKGRLLHM